MGRKQGVPATETRAKLVESAAQVFAERGYDGARVSEIARRAGLTTGAIYAHFGAKAELLAEAIATYSPDELGRLLESGDGPDILAALRDAGRQLPRPPRDVRHRALVLEALVAGRRDPIVAELVAKGFAERERRFTLLLRRARAAGLVDATLSPEAVTRLATMLAIGSVAIGELGIDDVDPDDWEHLVDTLVTLLTGATANRSDHAPTGLPAAPADVAEGTEGP